MIDARLTDDELIQEMVQACQVLYKCGVVDFIGHISVRRADGNIWIKPRAESWLQLDPARLLTLNLEGEVVDGDPSGRPAEWPIHTEVYKQRGDVHCVMHAHPAESTLMASLGLDPLPLTRDLVHTLISGVGIYSDPADPNMLMDSREEALKLVAALGDNTSVVIKYHGTLIVGRRPGSVCVAAYQLERAARAMLQADLARQSHDDLVGLMAAISTRAADKERVAKDAAERWNRLKEDVLRREPSAS